MLQSFIARPVFAFLTANSHRPGLVALLGCLVVAVILFGAVVPSARAQQAPPTLSEIVEAWLASPHADATAEAFTHWNEDGEIPGTCAVCHSATGLIDYVTGPMETVGLIDHPVMIGTVVDCATCHNAASVALQSVPFPSGARIETNGSSAVCTVCHQGRAWSGTVTAATADLPDDTPSADLGFVNTHYALAATAQQGSAASGAFEYPGQTYVGPFGHVPGLDTCTSCHAPHSLTVAQETCTACHAGANELRQIRTSAVDFDGDGDTAEGIADPIATLHDLLGQAIATYARGVAGKPVVYAPGTYPYFFVDTDADGAVSGDEASYPNRYDSWTPRMLRAAYNYQFVAKDGAVFAHNPHYALQILYDSLQDLGAERGGLDPARLSGLTRP